MRDVAKDILRLNDENGINMTHVGVIGGPNFSGSMFDLLDNISGIFENFISKSEYTKISYINDMGVCPTIKICENGNDKCDLYTHGYTTFSQYDMT